MDSLKSEMLQNVKYAGFSESAVPTSAKSLKKAKELSTEERYILCDLKMMRHKPVYEEFFQFTEAKQRAVNSESMHSAGSSLSVHVPDLSKADDEFSCSVCSDGDYEDDNLIVICSVHSTQTCEVAVHVKCYGIALVPSGDWICDMCQAYGPRASKELKCLICPVVGGALKETETLNWRFDEGQAKSSRNTEFVWCHVMCALNAQGVTVGDKERVAKISVAGVQEGVGKCQLCGGTEGVCVQCQHRKCDFSFHPECGKDMLVAGKKCGLDEGEVYCQKHRPVKLGKMIEDRDKKKVEDIVNFCRLWEKWESKAPGGTPFRRIRKRSDVDWTFEESEQLEEEIAHFLQQLNERQAKPFRILVNRRSLSRGGQVTVHGPDVYNFMMPEAILAERIAIHTRTPEECYRFYASRLMQRMRFELELCKAQIKVYTPKKPTATRARKRPVSPNDPTKRPHKHTISLLEPKQSQELFCVCRQPYIEMLPQNGMPDAEYQALIYRNSMVYCSGCNDWFHYGCIGFTPDGNVENNWLCAECRSK